MAIKFISEQVKWWATLPASQKITTYMLAGAIVAMYVAFNALEQTKQTMKERQGKCDERVAALELQVAELTNFIVFDTRRKRLIEDSLIHKIIKL